MTEPIETTAVEVSRVKTPVPANTQQVRELSPFEMMSTLIQQGVDLEKVEKMMALQERWEANEARKAYFAALSKFKSMDFTISKTEHVSYKNKLGKLTEYDHPDLARSLKILGQALSECGLVLTFTQRQEGNTLWVTAWLSHSMGHRESTTLSGPYDDSGGKNCIQSIGSSDSYLKRYTGFAITGVAAEGADNDGKASAPEPQKPQFITGKQLSEILDLADALPGDGKTRFLAHLKVSSYEEIPVAWFQQAKADLISARGAQ